MADAKAPKVTIKPSEQVIKAATTHVVVNDGRGRAITLKKPGPLAQYRLIEVLGDSAKNEVYTGMVLPLIFVAAIDEDQISQPTTKRELEALIQTLDEEGIEAVMQGVQENFGKGTPEENKKKSEQ